MATAIFYGSNTGNTENVAEMIGKELSIESLFNIRHNPIEKIKEFDKLIIGVSTWGEGDLQDDWEEHMDTFSDIDFSGKTVAFFGLGDQDEFEDYFLDAMGTLYEQVKVMGGDVVGSWPVDDYDYEDSQAVINGKFVGLGIDEDNQSEMTRDRVTAWCNQIKGDIL